MSLDPRCLDFKGKALCCKPYYGWGWSRLDKTDEFVAVDYSQVDRAGTFYIHIHRFFSLQGELRGVVGRVEQTGHLFDGLWAVTWTMIVGQFDFTERLCHRWDIELGPAEPVGDDWPHIRGVSPIYSGFGVLTASDDVLLAEETRRKEKVREEPAT